MESQTATDAASGESADLSAPAETAANGVAPSPSSSPLPLLAEPSPSGVTLADYQSTGRVTRNRTRAAEGKEIRKPRYNFKANAPNPNAPEKPRWYNQTYLLFLALRKAGEPLPRGKLIPMALQLDMELSRERGLPPLFGGKVRDIRLNYWGVPMAVYESRRLTKQPVRQTPQNTASGILTENRDQLFVSFKPEGQKHVYFKLSYEPGNFSTALEAYNRWNDTLIQVDWPYLFSKNRPAYEAMLRGKKLIASPSRSSTPTAATNGDEPEEQSTDGRSPVKALAFEDVKDEASRSLQGSDLASQPAEDMAALANSPKRKREVDENTDDESQKKVMKSEPTKIDQEACSTGHSGTQALPLVPLDALPDEKQVKALEALERTKVIRLADANDPELIFTNADDDDIPKSLRDILEVKESTIPNAGRGVFAKRFIPAITEVGFYFGVPMTEDEFDSLKGTVGVSNAYAHRYRLTVIDGTNDEGQPYPVDNPHFYCPFHFVNEDARRANMLFYAGPQVNQIICITTKDIQPGEELFVNYGTAVERHWDLPPEEARGSRRSTPDPHSKATGAQKPKKRAATGRKKRNAMPSAGSCPAHRHRPVQLNVPPTQGGSPLEDNCTHFPPLNLRLQPIHQTLSNLHKGTKRLLIAALLVVVVLVLEYVEAHQHEWFESAHTAKSFPPPLPEMPGAHDDELEVLDDNDHLTDCDDMQYNDRDDNDHLMDRYDMRYNDSDDNNRYDMRYNDGDDNDYSTDSDDSNGSGYSLPSLRDCD
ncbi:Histone-lysine N-methyltransferase setd7 [Geranomyces michiganensis]|nr:Histone-lysine N-methyltransferase setd7 [Geranomyces michiganensis]